MGRKATGTIHRYAPATDGAKLGHYVVRCPAPDGSRPLFDLDPSPRSPQAKRRAQETAAAITEQLAAGKLGAAISRTPKGRARGDAIPAGGETLEKYSERWFLERTAAGLSSVRSDQSSFRLHVVPVLGSFPIHDVSKGDVEGFVAVMDGKVREGLSWKTAINVWAVLRRMFRDASRSKVAALRVRDDNPAAEVEGPDRGAHKAKTYLFPTEFLALMRCEAVPLGWRRLIALSVYLGTRAGELEALSWDDVDVERGIVLVHRAADRTDPEREKTKTTKTGGTRRFTAEPAIAVLLRAMHREAGGLGRVVPDMPHEAHLAKALRQHLQRAGLVRADLYADDATRKPLGFHDLRSTFCTWAAVRGDDPLRIQYRAGHSTFATTQRYIREAEAVRDGFGDVFPPLPACLLGASEDPPREADSVTDSVTIWGKSAKSLSGWQDLNRGGESRSSTREQESCQIATREAPATDQSFGGNSAEPSRAVAENDDSIRAPSTPRARMIAVLTAELGEALDVGDLEAAKVAHQALGRLLGSDGAASPVADLGAERVKRGRP